MSRKAVRWDSRRQASSGCSQRPLVLVVDDVFPRFGYAVITLKTAAMDTPNKVAVLVTDDPAMNAHQKYVLFENLPFCSIFVRIFTKHNL